MKSIRHPDFLKDINQINKKKGFPEKGKYEIRCTL